MTARSGRGEDESWWAVRVRIFTNRFFRGYTTATLDESDVAEALPYPLPRDAYGLEGIESVVQIPESEVPSWVLTPAGPPPDARVLEDDGETGALPEGDEPWEDALGYALNEDGGILVRVTGSADAYVRASDALAAEQRIEDLYNSGAGGEPNWLPAWIGLENLADVDVGPDPGA